jgi:two-component system chemotaxis response regulator CheB
VKSAAPDVLTLDLQMPGGDGLELLRTITEGVPISVVVISGITRLAAATTLHALELGGPATRRPASLPLTAALDPIARGAAIKSFRPTVNVANNVGAVIIGASTGGPKAISELLQHLPREFATPCVIVQHLPATFTAPFAAQLSRHARIAVKEAETGDRLVPGRALVTPGSSHLLVRPGGLIELRPAADDDLYRPSIDLTMISAAESCGASAVGVLLTGMGHDGADGLKRIRDAGGDTYVQELTSCVVTSMPERAIERGGAEHIARPERIGQMLAGRTKP